MFTIFGRNKPLDTIQSLSLEKDLSWFKKVRYILELEGELCSLHPEFNNDNLRKAVHKINKDYNAKIYKEVCHCNNKQKAKLNLDGTPRLHKKYVKDWAI